MQVYCNIENNVVFTTRTTKRFLITISFVVHRNKTNEQCLLEVITEKMTKSVSRKFVIRVNRYVLTTVFSISIIYLW